MWNWAEIPTPWISPSALWLPVTHGYIRVASYTFYAHKPPQLCLNYTLETPRRKSVVGKFTLCGLFIFSEQKLVPFGRNSFKQNLTASSHKLEGYWYVHNLMHKNWMNIPGMKMQPLTYAERFLFLFWWCYFCMGGLTGMGHQSHWLLSSLCLAVLSPCSSPQCWGIKQSLSPKRNANLAEGHISTNPSLVLQSGSRTRHRWKRWSKLPYQGRT